MFVIGLVIKRWVSYLYDNVILILRIFSIIKILVFVILFFFFCLRVDNLFSWWVF